MCMTVVQNKYVSVAYMTILDSTLTILWSKERDFGPHASYNILWMDVKQHLRHKTGSGWFNQYI